MRKYRKKPALGANPKLILLIKTVIIMSDEIKHPTHYTYAGFECKEVTRKMTFNIGNVFKYAYRAGHKTSSTKATDLKKAIEYIDDAMTSPALIIGLFTNPTPVYRARKSFSDAIFCSLCCLISINNGNSSVLKLADVKHFLSQELETCHD